MFDSGYSPLYHIPLLCRISGPGPFCQERSHKHTSNPGSPRSAGGIPEVLVLWAFLHISRHTLTKILALSTVPPKYKKLVFLRLWPTIRQEPFSTVYQSVIFSQKGIHYQNVFIGHKLLKKLPSMCSLTSALPTAVALPLTWLCKWSMFPRPSSELLLRTFVIDFTFFFPHKEETLCRNLPLLHVTALCFLAVNKLHLLVMGGAPSNLLCHF